MLPSSFNIPIKASLADVNHLCGSLDVVVAVISMGKVVRTGRYLNVLLGLAVALLPWFIGDGGMAVKIIGTVGGVVVAGLSIPGEL